PVAIADGSVVGALDATYSLDEVQAILSRLNLTSLLLAAGAVLVAALAGLMLATSVARPAGQVSQAALALASRRPTGLPFGPQSTSAFPAPLPEPRGSTEEIRALVQAFNRLADQPAGRHQARRRRIALQVRLPVGPMPLNGDPIRLTQALGNLIENALKYAGSGGWVRVDVGPPLFGSYELAVTDSGPGIPLDVLPRVFERYFRVEGRASGGPGGMGLGLAIARALAPAHGGAPTAERPGGAGARCV